VHCAALHKLRLDAITTDQIIKLVLDPIRHQIENARDARQRLKLIFDAAIADGHRKDNPADYETKLRPKLGKAPKRGRARGHHKGISHHELPALVAKFDALPDLSARALEVTTLTVARTSEIRHMKWSQLDLDAGLWQLKASDIPRDETEGGDGEGQEQLRQADAAAASGYRHPARAS
jgi:integrase